MAWKWDFSSDCQRSATPAVASRQRDQSLSRPDRENPQQTHELRHDAQTPHVDDWRQPRNGFTESMMTDPP